MDSCAKFSNIFISTIFIVWGLYALSGAGVVRKFPLLKSAIYAIAIVCIIRGILPLQFWLRHPEKINDVAFYYGIGWLFTGLLYLFGFRMTRGRVSK